MSRLNAHQVRHVLATFAHVDGLLQDIERVARDDLSPFAKERPDFAPDEARLMASFILAARARLLTALDRLGIARPTPTTSARWTASTALTFADIALSELTEDALRGFGAVDPDAAREVTALASDLRSVVARGKALLHEHDPGGLADRVGAVPGPAGEVLRAVERLSAERGFAELRPLIAAAVDRVSATTFDVGVFGRVSAGKSSLINRLVDTPVLPVGATPVTSVPVRLAHGDVRVTITFADGTGKEIGVADLPDFATEERNPQNAKGVRAIDVRVRGVPPGLRLLDTPGVGSLGASGPAQAFAWLPRCDLGLVLIAAGSAVAHDDLALVAGLDRAGIACRVLLSKADLLTDTEIARATAYVQGELASVLGPSHGVDVLAVSTIDGHEATLALLRTEVLAPLAADHARAASAALKARLHRLVAAAETALSGDGRAREASVESYAARNAAAEIVRRETDRLAHGAERALDDAADAVVVAWASGADPRAAARAKLLDAGAATLAAVRQAVDEANERTGTPPRRRLPPLFDPGFLEALPPLDVPALGARMFARRAARGRLEPIGRPLGEALARYAARLYAWGMGQLDEQNDADEATDVSHAGGPSTLAPLHALIDQS